MLDASEPEPNCFAKFQSASGSSGGSTLIMNYAVAKWKTGAELLSRLPTCIATDIPKIIGLPICLAPAANPFGTEVDLASVSKFICNVFLVNRVLVVLAPFLKTCGQLGVTFRRLRFWGSVLVPKTGTKKNVIFQCFKN